MVTPRNGKLRGATQAWLMRTIRNGPVARVALEDTYYLEHPGVRRALVTQRLDMAILALMRAGHLSCANGSYSAIGG